jgi:hypothetical protein
MRPASVKTRASLQCIISALAAARHRYFSTWRAAAAANDYTLGSLPSFDLAGRKFPKQTKLKARPAEGKCVYLREEVRARQLERERSKSFVLCGWLVF